jgi:hypothetical protein
MRTKPFIMLLTEIRKKHYTIQKRRSLLNHFQLHTIHGWHGFIITMETMRKPSFMPENHWN